MQRRGGSKHEVNEEGGGGLDNGTNLLFVVSVRVRCLLPCRVVCSEVRSIALV